MLQQAFVPESDDLVHILLLQSVMHAPVRVSSSSCQDYFLSRQAFAQVCVFFSLMLLSPVRERFCTLVPACVLSFTSI